MDMTLKQQFIDRWQKYFGEADLPITFYYTNEEGHGELFQVEHGHHCIICNLAGARKGESIYFDVNAIHCLGGKRYLGFKQTLRPDFEYFLSCGIPGKLEGERYKKSPELVKEQLKQQQLFIAPAKYIVFKRWDALNKNDEPLVVVFFAQPDVLSGLFTLANFDEETPQGVITPMGSGCSTIVHYPYLELKSDHPKAIIGMFDVSARPCVSANTITFAVPLPKFKSMVNNMDESFLITESWNKVRKRIVGKNVQ